MCWGVWIAIGGRSGWSYERWQWNLFSFFCIFIGLAFLVRPWTSRTDEQQSEDNPCSHNSNTVTQKLLTTLDYCNTLLRIGRTPMANVLSVDKQATIIGLLAEGSSIRSIERVTGVHRDTIMRLGVQEFRNLGTSEAN